MRSIVAHIIRFWDIHFLFLILNGLHEQRKSWRTRWAGYVASIGAMLNGHNIVVRKCKTKRSLEDVSLDKG
jgi:hypothetical protein